MAGGGYLGLEGGLFGGGTRMPRPGGMMSGGLFGGESGGLPLGGGYRPEMPQQKPSAGQRFGEQDLTQNPILAQLLQQVLGNLDQGKQRRQTRRQFSNYGSALGRNYDQALNQTREGLAGRGLGSSGYGAGLELANRQGLAQQMAALPGQYHAALQERQQQARQEALQQILAFLGLQGQQEGLNFNRKQLKEGRPSQFQSVLGDVNAVTGAIGSLGKGVGAFI